MLQQDYIMRLTREFMEALARMLHKTDEEQRRLLLQALYRQYVGNYDFYHHATPDEVFIALAGESAERRAMKMEMLAELFYQDAQLESEPLRHTLLEKARVCMLWLDEHSGVYSIGRMNRLQEISDQLQSAGKQ